MSKTVPGSSSPSPVATARHCRLAPARPARPLPRPRVDKDPHELLSLLPRFPLSLARSLLRENTEDAETLARRRRAIAGVLRRHCRIAWTRSCASRSSTTSRKHARWDAAISSSSSFYRIDTALSSSDRKSTRLNSSHSGESRMPSSA